MNSLESFVIALYDHGFLKGNGTEINDLLEYYKKIHRQQIVAAYKAAMHTQYLESYIHTRYGTIHKADDYYNKTYGDGIPKT